MGITLITVPFWWNRSTTFLVTHINAVRNDLSTIMNVDDQTPPVGILPTQIRSIVKGMDTGAFNCCSIARNIYGVSMGARTKV